MTLLLFLLLFFAGLIFLYPRHVRQKALPTTLPKNYLKGLNFLLNEQPDKAVDIFIDLLAVDEHTVETHLSLGNLFRRRGEVDRAIKIHQNVIARPQLDHSTRVEALIALGEDYLSAGVLDRAERVFQEVMILDASSETALLYLLDIYQQEKEWQKAIAMAEKLPNYSQYQARIAHYYCEIAELALAKKNAHEVQQAVKEALSRDPTSLRAHLAQADDGIQRGMYDAAIKCLKRVHRLNSRFLPEIFDRLKRCYDALGDREGLLLYLRECMQDNPHSGILLELIRIFTLSDEREKLQHDLKQHLLMHPSLKGLDAHLQCLEGGDKEVAWIKSMVESLKKRDATYQCQACGYSGNIFRWQCPSCKRWGEVLPITY